MNDTTIDLNERIARLEAIVSSIPKHESTGLSQKSVDSMERRLQSIEQRFAERERAIAGAAADAAIAALDRRLASANETQLRAVGTVLADLRKETNATINGTASDIRKELHALDELAADSFVRAEKTLLDAVSRLSPSFRS